MPKRRRSSDNDSGGGTGGGGQVNVGSGGGADGGSVDGEPPGNGPRNDQGGVGNQRRSSQEDSEVVTTSDVELFRAWCLTKLETLEELEPREKLLKLLCRAPSDSHKMLQRNLPRDLELARSPHDCDDDDGKHAELANRIRLAEHDGTLTDGAVDLLAAIPGWADPSNDHEPWGIGDMCFCATCVKSTFKGLYTARYRERLVRRKEWYHPDDELRLLELIAKHWVAFFYCLQQLPYAHYDAAGNHPLLHRDGPRISMNDHIGGLFHADLDDPQAEAKREAKRELWTDKVGLKREAYEAIALMNQHRRDQYRHTLIYERLSRLSPRFDEDPNLNFEGTEEDHYCLGSRRTGHKFYVGVSNNEIQRHAQHAGQVQQGQDRGAYYIKFMTNRLTARVPDLFGGWKLDEKTRRDGKTRAYDVDTKKGPWSTEDEDESVIRCCNNHGLHHVRGGVHVFPKLSESEMAQLRSFYRARYDLCKVCGSDKHKAKTCPMGGQQANEDDALLAHMNLSLGSSEDKREDEPFERAGIIAGMVCGSLPVSRLVCMSNSAETDAVPAHGKLGNLIDALYGDGARRELRPLQTQAMQHVVDDQRPDITLTVPTAYGKTRVYTVAAVHEVIYGAGRAVIFLPFSALMSDIACEFAELCDGEYDEVVEHQADDRARDSKMPYGGVLHVNLKNDEGQIVRHPIIWTIWRGYSGDEHMRMHTDHRCFRNAQIIMATSDKWAYPDPDRDENGMPRMCDSFLTAWGHDTDSREEWISKLGLVVIDEAHEFKEVLGGQMRELLRRIRTLHDVVKKKRKSVFLPQRVMLVSATIPHADKFSEDLLGRPGAKLVRPTDNSSGSASFLFEPSRADSENKEPLDYNDLLPGERVGKEDAEALVVDKLSDMKNHRHRILLLLPDTIKLRDVPNNIISPSVLGAGLQSKKALVRRILIFLDSKVISAQLVRLLKSPKFVDAWKTAENVEVTVTPYHGSVARMHRRVYEGMMRHFVKEPSESSEQPEPQHLHVIVATSALETGVNVKGIDVVIILDASRCSRESLLQRIGRAGRVAGKPAVCIIGVLQDEVATSDERNDDGDADEAMPDEPGDDDEEAVAHQDTTTQPDLMRDPVAYLQTTDTPVALANSRAMKLHSARQLMRNMKTLKYSEQQKQKALDELNVEICLSSLDDELGNEITARDDQQNPCSDGCVSKDMGMRGSNSGVVSIRLCHRVNQTTGDVQTRGVATRRGRGKPFVELARIDALKCFEQAHWRAHFQDPHGKFYRVVAIYAKRGEPLDARTGRWLPRLEAVHVVKLLPGDTMYVFKTRGDKVVCSQFVQSLDGPETTSLRLPPKLRIGTVRTTIKWKGFRYINPHNGHEVGDYQPATDPMMWHPPYEDVNPERPSSFNRPFFQPAKFRFSGWEWTINEALPDDLKATFSFNPEDKSGMLARNALADELKLRICEKLGCGRQDLSVEFVTSNHRDDCACKGDVKIDAGMARLLVYESSATGLAKQSLRGRASRIRTPTNENAGTADQDDSAYGFLDGLKLRKISSNDDLKIHNNKEYEGYEDAVRECANWLWERWRAEARRTTRT